MSTFGKSKMPAMFILDMDELELGERVCWAQAMDVSLSRRPGLILGLLKIRLKERNPSAPCDCGKSTSDRPGHGYEYCPIDDPDNPQNGEQS